MLRAPQAVEPVVPRHDTERASVAHGVLEGDQVDLAQRAFVDHRAHGVALELGIVAHEVLDRRRHAGGLGSFDEGGGQPPRQEGILGVTLEIATGQGRPGDVHRRGQQDPASSGARFLGQQGTDVADEIRIPGGSERRSARHARRGLGLGARQGRPAGAVRSVGDAHRRDPEAGNAGNGPQILPGGERRLLVHREIGDETPHPGVGCAPRARCRLLRLLVHGLSLAEASGPRGPRAPAAGPAPTVPTPTVMAGKGTR